MVEINNRTKNKVDLALLKKTAQKFLESRKKGGYELSIAIVGDAEMRKLNKAYRELDKPTDVLSFAGEGNFYGEIILDFAQIKKQAKELKKSIKEELIFILVHGLLHLEGMDDKTEKGGREMEKKAVNFIKKNKF